MKEIFFSVPGKPQGKDRPRGVVVFNGGKRGFSTYSGKSTAKPTVRMVTTKKTESYESLIGILAKQQMKGREPFLCPIRVDITLFYPISKSWPATKKLDAQLGKIGATVKPDIDNCVKAIYDALNKVVWNDDAQVVDEHVCKLFSDEPRVDVRITPLINLLAV